MAGVVCFCLLVFFSATTPTCRPETGHRISKHQGVLFKPGVIVGTVTSSKITEASGLAASRRHPGILYTHNDSGGKSNIYAIDANTGKRIATLEIDDVANKDWEDIAVGNCGSDYCIYVGDTGERGGRGAQNKIYRIKEPYVMRDAHLQVESRLLFSWKEPDTETVMVAPSGDVYIVSKVQGGRGKMAQLPSYAWGTGTRVNVTVSVTLPLQSSKRDPVGGDISPDGSEVLIKMRDRVYYWKLGERESYATALARPPTDLPYISESQGEAICWSDTGSGYYTLSEGEDQHLYYYVRQVS